VTASAARGPTPAIPAVEVVVVVMEVTALPAVVVVAPVVVSVPALKPLPLTASVHATLGRPTSKAQ
jgi:hypothetical protein